MYLYQPERTPTLDLPLRHISLKCCKDRYAASGSWLLFKFGDHLLTEDDSCSCRVETWKEKNSKGYIYLKNEMKYEVYTEVKN